jgi:5-methylcytosine-specific restriction endonuclease McrBC regulatory subunit McrC
VLWFLSQFLEALNLRIDLRLARSSLVCNRMNEHYYEAHELAWLILGGLGIEDIFATGSQQCFAFLLDMNRLFQAFTVRWLGQVFAGSELRVKPERRDRTILWNAAPGRPYAWVIPDLLIERTGQSGTYLPVDAKYKLYDQRSIATGDIYQTLLYAYAYGEKHPVLPTAFVLYRPLCPMVAKCYCTSAVEVVLQAPNFGLSLSTSPRRSPKHGLAGPVQLLTRWSA